MIDILNCLSEELNIITNYEFLEYRSKPVYPYFVGNYLEIPTNDESGYSEFDFILTGFNRNSFFELEKIKEIIKEKFIDYRKVLDNKSFAIFFENAFPIQTGNDELKRIEIHLKIKEWRI